MFKAFMLCILVFMWAATREMMQLASKERILARIGLWTMRILILLMFAPFLFLGYAAGLTVLSISATAMMAVGIFAVIMRLCLERSDRIKIPV